MYRDRNGVEWAMVPEAGGMWHAVPWASSAKYYDPAPAKTQSSSQQGAVASFIEQYAAQFAANVRDRASVPGWVWLVIGYVLLKGR